MWAAGSLTLSTHQLPLPERSTVGWQDLQFLQPTCLCAIDGASGVPFAAEQRTQSLMRARHAL